MLDLVLATSNPGKLKELRALSEGMPSLNLLLAPAGFNPDETGSTYIENAVIKAREAARQTGVLSVADDSGIAVDAMGGRPGIHSARYAPGNDRDRRLKLLEENADVPADQRGAAFVCAMAVVDKEDNIVFTCECRWPGKLATFEKGEHGFGFDPIFLPDDAIASDQGLTAAQIAPEIKNKISHRGQAWQQVLNFLTAYQK